MNAPANPFNASCLAPRMAPRRGWLEIMRGPLLPLSNIGFDQPKPVRTRTRAAPVRGEDSRIAWHLLDMYFTGQQLPTFEKILQRYPRVSPERARRTEEMARWLLSLSRKPTVYTIAERWDVSRATSYKWVQRLGDLWASAKTAGLRYPEPKAA